MSQNDLRIRRTHLLVRNAFLDIMNSKRFEEITVQMIVDQAMVNRATFYRHYMDKYDLALKIIESDFDQLLKNNPPPPENIGEIRLDLPQPTWVRLFEVLAQKPKLYRVALVEGNDPTFRRTIRQYVETVFGERLKGLLAQKQTNLRIPMEVIIEYTSAAFLGMIVWWLENEMPITPTQAAIWLQQLLILGPYYGLGLTPPIKSI